MHADRADAEYFRRLPREEVTPRADPGVDEAHPRFAPAASMLEIHPGTATESGTLAGLTRLFSEIGREQRAGEDLTPAERNFVGYDGVQLMPVEPLTESDERPDYWRPGTDPGSGDGTGDPVTDGPDTVTITAERPDPINWGYDIVVSGFGAINPGILETGRPDELVELQRRKMDFGADGVRVDGARDFTNYDPERGEWHDDAFLASMDQVQEVAGQRYYPRMIYEDGRPWPRQDWELASTYRTLIEQHPHSFQWGPLTFAHNTPALLTFRAAKWWWAREVADVGGHWISGVANHDTLRRGSQLPVPESREGDPINPYLGDDPTDIYERAYDNPATDALMHAFLPGVPMDFTHANVRAPWGFVRDTDPDWNVTVVAEEHNFVDWQIRPEHFADDRFFSRLREFGFSDPDALGSFVDALANAIDTAGMDLETAVDLLAPLETPFDGPTPDDIEAFAMAWMRDVADFCNLAHWHDAQDETRTAFDRSVREFRQARPWLRASRRDDEHFDYRHPANGTVVYYGLRRAPDGSEAVLFVGNMEGVETTVTSTELPIPGLPADGREPAIVPPGLDRETVAADGSVALANGLAVVYTRSP